MAEWGKNKVESSQINNGNEYEQKDRVSREQLNAIVNNSFYASDTATEAKEIAERTEVGANSPVSYAPQVLATDQQAQARANISSTSKSEVNSLSMCPSTSRVEIAITSGTETSYTATANGYICLGVVSTEAYQRNYIYDGGDLMTSIYSSANGQYIYLYLPATKGKAYEIVGKGTIRGCFLITSKEV